MAKTAKPNPFAKKGAAPAKGAKSGKPNPFAPKGAKGMVAPPKKAK